MRQLLKKGNIKAYENIRLSIKLAGRFAKIFSWEGRASHDVTYCGQTKTTPRQWSGIMGQAEMNQNVDVPRVGTLGSGSEFEIKSNNYQIITVSHNTWDFLPPLNRNTSHLPTGFKVGDLTSLKPQCLMQFGAEFIQFSNIFRSSLDPQLAKTLSEMIPSYPPSFDNSLSWRKKEAQAPASSW